MNNSIIKFTFRIGKIFPLGEIYPWLRTAILE